MDAARDNFGPFVLDRNANQLRRDGAVLPLGQRALLLLEALVDAGGAAVDKDTLMARAWPGVVVEESNLTVQIAALRKALGKGPDGQEWVATVPRIGYRLPSLARVAPAGGVQSRPVLAVMPFETAPEDREQAYFADGVVEDLITALSRFKTFAVVSRHAAFGYRDRELDLAAISTLGVRYVLEGSIRRRGGHLRVSVRLIETEASTNLWVQQFDGDAGQLFAFIDHIVEAVVGFAEPEVKRAEIARARRKPPVSLDAYDYYLRALPLFRGTSAEVRAEAIRLLEEAVRLDPGFAPALAHAAWAYERQETFGDGVTTVERARALELADAALVAGHDDPLVVAISALVLMALGGTWQRSILMMADAVRLNPNNPTVLSLAAFCNVTFGDIDLGLSYYRRALEISPGALDNYELLVGIGLGHLMKGEFEESLTWSLRSIAANGDWLGAHWALASAYAHLDRMEEARATVATMLEKAPGMRVATLARIGTRFPAEMQARRHALLLDGVRKAGLPE